VLKNTALQAQQKKKRRFGSAKKREAAILFCGQRFAPRTSALLLLGA
jgi:hypothetical protein